MKRNPRLVRRPIATLGLGLVLACLSGLAGSADAHAPRPLSNDQLDAVTAGVTATGSGSANADGAQTNSVSSVNTSVGQGAQGGLAVGQAGASAVAPEAGRIATATATLSLMIVSP